MKLAAALISLFIVVVCINISAIECGKQSTQARGVAPNNGNNGAKRVAEHQHGGDTDNAGPAMKKPRQQQHKSGSAVPREEGVLGGGKEVPSNLAKTNVLKNGGVEGEGKPLKGQQHEQQQQKKVAGATSPTGGGKHVVHQHNKQLEGQQKPVSVAKTFVANDPVPKNDKEEKKKSKTELWQQCCQDCCANGDGGDDAANSSPAAGTAMLTGSHRAKRMAKRCPDCRVNFGDEYSQCRHCYGSLENVTADSEDEDSSDPSSDGADPCMNAISAQGWTCGECKSNDGCDHLGNLFLRDPRKGRCEWTVKWAALG